MTYLSEVSHFITKLHFESKIRVSKVIVLQHTREDEDADVGERKRAVTTNIFLKDEALSADYPVYDKRHSAFTVVPCPGDELIEKMPPVESTRCCILSRPMQPFSDFSPSLTESNPPPLSSTLSRSQG
jgi:hypothetical protein